MPTRKKTDQTVNNDLKVYRQDRFGRKHPITEKDAAQLDALSPSDPALPAAD